MHMFWCHYGPRSSSPMNRSFSKSQPHFLQADDKYEFAEPSRIQGLVKNYSQFVSFPIYTWQEQSRTVEVRKPLFFSQK